MLFLVNRFLKIFLILFSAIIYLSSHQSGAKMIILDIIFYVNPFQDFFNIFFLKHNNPENRTQNSLLTISSLIHKETELRIKKLTSL